MENEKKRCIFLFCSGWNKYIYIYKIKKRKKIGSGTKMGYCPNCIAIQFIVLQETGLFGWKKCIARLRWYCKRWERRLLKLYCNTIYVL